MASILMGTVGSVVGGAIGGPLGASLGSGLGRVLGASLDNALFGSGSVHSEGARLSDLLVQTSTYGRMIPLVYGASRVAGNVIWSTPLKETATTTTRSVGGGKGGGGSASQSATTYSYSVTIAIALCEGPIDSVLRVWADAMQLDLSRGTYRLYKGTEDQMPDSAIVAREGVGRVPAYRGLAYVVIEDFPLGEFGNRIPNFTFEVRKKAEDSDESGESLEKMIRGVNLIPGAGEFVYDTKVQTKLYGAQIAGEWVQQGNRAPMNMHNMDGRANVLLSLDQLQETLPNLEWVGVVVSWFGTSLNAADCVVVPGVEYSAGSTTNPDVWQVAGRHRGNAYLITQVDGVPRYGGTPDDGSILRLVAELRARGLKVMFYPMFFMDVVGKPWRGHVSGSASFVSSFFTKTNGYNAFIMHYANVLVGKVDAFCIGSELKGLTAVASAEGMYPAVTALASLAENVKAVMGEATKLTYAADWSEYHHTEGGWYNLDALWASPAIDMVGIDAYFPLADGVQQGYDVEVIREGWRSGEGYDWYYADGERTQKEPLGAAYAWKNIRWWWENGHVNPNGQPTAWVPCSKKIWLTEYGFPSVDGAANEPNVFSDPESVDGGYPRHSRGRIDFRAQRTALMATEQEWHDSEMIERMFIWAWDARPFPYWPDLTEFWADGGAWQAGHWIQGKVGISGLAAIVGDVMRRAGIAPEEVDTSRLSHLVEGCVVTSAMTARQVLEQLMAGFFFDIVESGGMLKCVPRGGGLAKAIPADDLVPMAGERGGRDMLVIRRQQEVELPKQVNMLYFDRGANYMQGNQFAVRQATESRQVRSVSLPIVFSDQGARVLAEQMLYNLWMERTTYEFSLPMAYAALEPADVVAVEHEGRVHQVRVTSVSQSRPGILHLRGVAEDAGTYEVYFPPAIGGGRVQASIPVGETALRLLDMPALPEDNLQQGYVRMALAGLEAGWKGAAVYRSDDGGEEYGWVAGSGAAAAIGSTLQALPIGKTAVIDEVNAVEVMFVGQVELAGVSERALLNGANTCLIGEEVVQFRSAELISEGVYRLSGLLRGRLGTEFAMGSHVAGESCVVLSGAVQKVEMPLGMIGLARMYKGVSIGSTLGASDVQYFSYGGKALRPYSPVQLSAERDGAGNMHISWVRRARGGGEWRDYIDVPLGEADERYEIEVLEGGVVKRLLHSAVPSVEYSAASQITDFGTEQSSVQVRVYQMSQVIGRGYAAAAMI